MSILSWLRKTVADFFLADTDELTVAAADAECELAAARTLAVAAIAQAQRVALELADALEGGDADAPRITALSRRLQDAREHARGQIETYKARQAQLVGALDKMGQLARIEQVNRERERLRELVARTEVTLDADALADLEVRVFGETARLDFLDQVEQGTGPVLAQPTSSQADPDAVRHARRMLSDDRWLGV